jgi:hypothetical protein
MRHGHQTVDIILCSCSVLVPECKTSFLMLLCVSVLLEFEKMPCLIANRYMVRVSHSLNSPRSSFRFNIASYTGSVLKDDVSVSGDVSQRPGPRVRTFLYDNTDSSKPISVSNSGSETELYVFFPFLAQGMRDQGYGSLTVRSSDAETGIWIMQVADQSCIVSSFQYPISMN